MVSDLARLVPAAMKHGESGGDVCRAEATAGGPPRESGAAVAR